MVTIQTQAALRLVKPIEGTRWNITADNWYSSRQLAQELLKEDLSFVGTLKKRITLKYQMLSFLTRIKEVNQ